MLEMLKAVVPPLVRTAVCDEQAVVTGQFPKARLEGERLTLPVPVPVPERLTVCGLPVALSVTLTAAVRVPAAVGVKVTLMVQWAPAATLVPQLLDWPKSPGSAPVRTMLEIVKTAL